MKKTISIIILALSCLFLNACVVKPYKVEVQQGNLLEQEKVVKLHEGMTKSEVSDLLGEPVLCDAFRNENHWSYVYTDEKSNEARISKRVDLTFTDGKVSNIKMFKQGKECKTME